jgi:PAS fold.
MGVAPLDSKTIPNPQPNLPRHVFSQHSAAVILLDGEGKIQNLNAAAERLLNLPKASALNQSIDQVLKIHPQDNSNQCLLFPIQPILHQGLSIERVNHAILVNSQGQRMQVECSLLPFNYQNCRGAVLILQELSPSLPSEPSLFFTKESLTL